MLGPLSQVDIYLPVVSDSDIRSLGLRNPEFVDENINQQNEEGAPFKEVRIVFGGSKNFLSWI